MQLEDLRGWMTGEDCVVVGCGPSAAGPPSLPWNWVGNEKEWWTICCNRSVVNHPTDFALCVEPYRDAEVWAAVHAANPLIVFTHLSETASGRKAHPRSVKIGSKDVLEWLQPSGIKNKEPLRLGQSPFYAAAVAIFLGFENIGIIGVDWTADRCTDDEATRGNKAWRRLWEVAHVLGSRISNLSPTSRLKTIPQGEWQDIRTKGQAKEVPAHG